MISIKNRVVSTLRIVLMRPDDSRRLIVDVFDDPVSGRLSVHVNRVVYNQLYSVVLNGVWDQVRNFIWDGVYEIN